MGPFLRLNGFIHYCLFLLFLKQLLKIRNKLRPCRSDQDGKAEFMWLKLR